jgi:hypothetical protein
MPVAAEQIHQRRRQGGLKHRQHLAQMHLRKDSPLTQQAPSIANRGSPLSSIVVMLAIRRQGEHPIIKDWLKDGS